MQDIVYGTCFARRTGVFLADAFRTCQEAEDYAHELRRKGKKTWVETFERSAVNPKLWRSYGAHPLR